MTHNLTLLRRHTKAPLLGPARVSAERSSCMRTASPCLCALLSVRGDPVEESWSVRLPVGPPFHVKHGQSTITPTQPQRPTLCRGVRRPAGEVVRRGSHIPT